MAYSDLDGVHVPASGNRAPASWGLQVNANFDAIYTDVLAKLGVWTSYTPTLVQSGTVTKTVTHARYFKLGRLVIGQVLLAVTGSGSSASNITVSLPVTAAIGNNITAGVGSVYDSSAPATYPGRVLLITTGTMALSGTNATSGGYLGSTGFTAALASGDSVDMIFAYEAAS